MSEINLEQTVLKITLGDLVQQFTEEDLQKQMPVFMQDIDADTKELIDTYQLYLSEGKFSEAELFRSSHPELETRIWDSFKANSLLAYASYIYMYARNQSQQCIISEVQPPEGNGEDIIGQVEGDIWFRIDEIKDGIINTTPFQKQDDGSYKEFAVAPKLEFSTHEDIDEVYSDDKLELTHREALVNNEALKYYTKKYNDKLFNLEENFNKQIEQVFQSGSNAKQMIVDACVAAGLNITTEDSWNIIATTIEEDLLYIPPSGIATLTGSSTKIHSATVTYPTGSIKFVSNTPVITQSGNGVRFNKDTVFELTIRSWIAGHTQASVKCVIRLYKNGSLYKTLYSNGNVTKGTQGGQSMSVTITDTAKINDVFSMTAEAGPFGGDSGSCEFGSPKATFTTLK